MPWKSWPRDFSLLDNYQRSAVPTFLIRYQIRDWVNFLIKTKSKTETQIWFKTKPNPKPRLRFGSKQNQIQNRDSDLILSKTKSNTETQIWLYSIILNRRHTRRPCWIGHVDLIKYVLDFIWYKKGLCCLLGMCCTLLCMKKYVLVCRHYNRNSTGSNPCWLLGPCCNLFCIVF